jgi:SAM-dependent methyltransferase
VLARFEAFVVERLAMAARGCRSIVELGCGYGYNLHRLRRVLPDRAYLGGDIAPTAVQLARRLFAEDCVSVVEFDYYADDYTLLRDVEGPVLVFTCHSVEQLPKAGHMLDVLARHAGHIARVVHFEPVYESHGETLIGRLRRAYADSVDYNRDLLGLLRAHPHVRLEAIDANPFGINPLNPTTVVEWTFR